MSTRKQQALIRLARKLMADRVMLEEREVGDVRIEKEEFKKGDKLMLVGMREAYLTGIPQTDYMCKEPTTIHRLVSQKHGLWMSDIPAEMVQMRNELAKHARGRVLIGGLGLGILPRMVSRMHDVTSVTVVESSKDVVNLIWPQISPHLEGKGSILVDDVHNVEAKGLYETALLDTWQGTGEIVWVSEVVPLRRKFRRANVRRVRCWQESVMLGQVIPALLRVSALGASDPWRTRLARPMTRHYHAFAKALDHLSIQREISSNEVERFMLGHENAKNPAVVSLLSLFVHHVGSHDWERIFGRFWDEVAEGE